MKTTSIKDLSVSQNFLINSSFIEKLVESADIFENDLVIDIGAGSGEITEILSRMAKKVIAIEYDKVLFEKLTSRFKGNQKVKTVNDDFLKYNLPESSYKVFANPPFKISADILNKLLKLPSTMGVAYLLLQKETVERFKGGEKYLETQVATLIKPFWDISILKSVDKHEFRPIPHVDIVFSKFEKRKILMIDESDYQIYRDFVIYGYNQWKPTVIDAFGSVFTKDQTKIISKKYNLISLKPSDLNIEQWIGLFDTFKSYVSDEKKMIVKGFENKMNIKHKSIQKRNRTNLQS